MTEVYNILSYLHSLSNECGDDTFEVERVIDMSYDGIPVLSDYKTIFRDTIYDSQIDLPKEILNIIVEHLWAGDGINFVSCNKYLNYRFKSTSFWRKRYLLDLNEVYKEEDEGQWQKLYITKFNKIFEKEDKLWYVITNGYYRLIPFILKTKNFVQEMKRDPIQYLKQAVSSPIGLECIRTLCDNNWDIQEHLDQLLLYLTSVENSNVVNICKYLILKGADKEYANSDRHSVILLAGAYGRLGMCKVLVEHGTIIDSKMAGGATGLYWATRNGRHETLEYLISSGADYNMIYTENDNNTNIKRTPICTAIQSNHQECAKVLIKAKANPNIISPEGSALYQASAKGYHEIVQGLLELGADQTVIHNGKTPLFIASENGHDKVVEALCNNKAIIDIVCEKKTALFVACEKGHLNVALILVKHEANINFVGPDAQTPLFVACANNKIDIVELLCKNIPNFNTVDKYGNTLECIAKDGCKRMINFYSKVNGTSVA